MRAKRTSKAEFERMERVSAILALRYSGKSLADIGAEQVPPVSAQAIHALIGRALGHMPQQTTAEIRLLEANRLDVMTAVLWPAVLLGDLGAITTVLKIMCRRAAMMGLDLQRGFSFGREDGEEIDPSTIKVEIVGNPEIARVRWLEEERERLLALTQSMAPRDDTPTTLQ
jgi:hypothetical protein